MSSPLSAHVLNTHGLQNLPNKHALRGMSHLLWQSQLFLFSKSQSLAGLSLSFRFIKPTLSWTSSLGWCPGCSGSTAPKENACSSFPKLFLLLGSPYQRPENHAFSPTWTPAWNLSSSLIDSAFFIFWNWFPLPHLLSRCLIKPKRVLSLSNVFYMIFLKGK